MKTTEIQAGQMYMVRNPIVSTSYGTGLPREAMVLEVGNWAVDRSKHGYVQNVYRYDGQTQAYYGRAPYVRSGPYSFHRYERPGKAARGIAIAYRTRSANLNQDLVKIGEAADLWIPAVVPPAWIAKTWDEHLAQQERNRVAEANAATEKAKRISRLTERFFDADVVFSASGNSIEELSHYQHADWKLKEAVTAGRFEVTIDWLENIANEIMNLRGKDRP